MVIEVSRRKGSLGAGFGKGFIRHGGGAPVGFGRTYKCGEKQGEHPSWGKFCRRPWRQWALGWSEQVAKEDI